jgi:hypothetical protein
LVQEAIQYRWSSATAHLAGGDRWDILSMEDWKRCWTPQEWAAILSSGPEDSAQIREATTLAGRSVNPVYRAAGSVPEEVIEAWHSGSTEEADHQCRWLRIM